MISLFAQDGSCRPDALPYWMETIRRKACPNPTCKDRGKLDAGNIILHARRAIADELRPARQRRRAGHAWRRRPLDRGRQLGRSPRDGQGRSLHPHSDRGLRRIVADRLLDEPVASVHRGRLSTAQRRPHRGPRRSGLPGGDGPCRHLLQRPLRGDTGRGPGRRGPRPLVALPAAEQRQRPRAERRRCSTSRAR